MRRHWLAAAIPALLVVAGLPARAQAPGGPPPTVIVAKPVVKEVVEHDDYTGRFKRDRERRRARPRHRLPGEDPLPGRIAGQEGRPAVHHRPPPLQGDPRSGPGGARLGNARLNFSQTDLERAQTLSRSGNISEQVTDQRRQASLTAQADVESATAALRQAQLNYDFTEVRSPIDGRISQRRVTEGNIVITDQTILTSIVSLDPIYFSFPVDERSFLAYQGNLRIGMGATQKEHTVRVLIALTGEAKPTRKGVLDFVDNQFDAQTGSIMLRATVENPDNFIKPGLFGIISMPASPPFQGVLIPDEAVATNQDKRIVYVVKDDNTVASQNVRLGPKIDGYRVVRDGLKGDETIVISGLTRVRPGAKVTPERKDLPPVKE